MTSSVSELPRGGNWTRGTYAGRLATDIDGIYLRPRILEVGDLDALRLLAMLGIELTRQAEEEYQAQRRQALAAIAGGLLIMIMVIAGAV
jgi:hypothetical protein